LYGYDQGAGHSLSQALMRRIAQEGIGSEVGRDLNLNQAGTLSATTREKLDGWLPSPAEAELAKQREVVEWSRKDEAFDSKFRFGRKSLNEQKGVLPQLVEVSNLAIKYSTQDFMFHDGLRLPKEQEVMVARGASKTLKSKHLKQASGFGEAMDLVPVVGTLPKWDWDLIYPIVMAVDRAATELGYADSIVWGGAWDRRLADFGGDLTTYAAEVLAYTKRHAGKDFIDGPHFEWRG
jgi:peptidoglycan L-alanyl-D-glutamate endopeptidase CwlK